MKVYFYSNQNGFSREEDDQEDLEKVLRGKDKEQQQILQSIMTEVMIQRAICC